MRKAGVPAAVPVLVEWFERNRDEHLPGRCNATQLRQDVRDRETPALQRQIRVTDKQIDQLVYALYGVTGVEIRIVREDG
jgi:hypothetical protein